MPTSLAAIKPVLKILAAFEAERVHRPAGALQLWHNLCAIAALALTLGSAPADAAERIPRAFVGDWCRISIREPPLIFKRTRPNDCPDVFTIRPDGTIVEVGDSDGCKIMPTKFIKPNDFLAKLRCGDETTPNRRFTMDSGRMILRFP
jgi:hypothetical protein